MSNENNGWIRCSAYLPPKRRWVYIKRSGTRDKARRVGIFGMGKWDVWAELRKRPIEFHDWWKPIDD